MREVNFSIPNVNKASVGITTALYDRRALDCTSTLPLINSLNHLAYLTTSSARIRDILTVDGGIERLVCILKQGRSQEMMEMWKWNLAFQCVVNIGVRGSEAVRTRVVEADMVPVIATILDNYIKVIEKHREKVEAEVRRSAARCPSAKTTSRARDYTNRPAFHDRGHATADQRPSRRQAPPPAIEIPQNNSQQHRTVDTAAMEITPTLPQLAVTSPQDRSPFSPHRHSTTQPHHHHHHHHHHHRSQELRYGQTLPTNLPRPHGAQELSVSASNPNHSQSIGLRPVRDIDRLPSMVPFLPNDADFRPISPTTPSAPTPRTSEGRSRRRPSLQQQMSNSGDSDDAIGDASLPEPPLTADRVNEAVVDISSNVDIQGSDDQEALLDAVATPISFDGPNGPEVQEAVTFNITHRSVADGDITNLAPAVDTGIVTANQRLTIIPVPPNPPSNLQDRFYLDRTAPPGVLAATPRDEDVLMSLQLLAYVSKYCNLRVYFQQCHLVPRLQLAATEDGSIDGCKQFREELEVEEYLLPDDFNIFPLVEKFTVRHHSQDMQYWAGVVMRNLCRKDDTRGGIRQCAYYECGKWEQKTRQFAKCRRCRRTKYCSKDCQKNAWVFHRHWCQVPSA
ncbi:hypothetical protein MMC25_007572 [Agyrium rufum]|nr:hypothetical protein [Agyrium rufum]